MKHIYRKRSFIPMINDLRQNCNEMNILCTDARVPERVCRVVIENIRVPV